MGEIIIRTEKHYNLTKIMIGFALFCMFSFTVRGMNFNLWQKIQEFLPEDTMIVSAFNDGTIRVWSGEGFQDSIELRGHSHMVKSAIFGYQRNAMILKLLDH